MTTSRSQRRRWLFISLYPVYLLALGWLGIQGYWYFQEKKTGVAKTDVWIYYYPNLFKARNAEIVESDRTLDVLLLGASVLEQVAPVFERMLSESTTRPVRVFALSTSAHTSRDSYFKFMQLKHQPFDLVVVYNGINDVRMNCVADELYQADYTHCRHYRSINRASEAGALSIKGTALDRMDQWIGLDELIPERIDFGDSIKTPPAYRANLEGIINEASARPARVVLMTFAIWIPPEYSEERFLEGTLNYGEGRYQIPVETWGKKDNVIRTIAAQNDEVRDLASKHDVIFVDQARLMPKDGRHFSDVCHLTELGLERFAKNLLDGIQSQLEESATMPP